MLPRKMLVAFVIISTLALAIALVSQHVYGMLPCPWCILQRILYLIILVLSILGIILPFLRKFVLGFISLISLTGAGIAIYQITVAAQTFSCDQTIADQIITSSGLDVLAPWFFGVYASCMEAAVDLFGIEYAVWSLVLFVALAAASATALWINCRLRQTRG